MDVLKKNHRKFISGLDRNLKNSLEHYSRDSTSINHTLRGRREPTEKIKNIISDIDSVFLQLDVLQTPLTLFRGIDDEKYLNDIAFVSTSYEEEVAGAYSQDECCIIVINVPVGAKVIFIESISQNKDDKEVLLERGGSFSKTHVNVKSGKKYIYVSYIPPSTSVSKDLPKLVKQSEKEDEIVNFIASNIEKSEIESLKEMGLEDEIETIINDIYKKITNSGKNAPESIVRSVVNRF